MAGEQTAIAEALEQRGAELEPELDLFAPPASVEGAAKAKALQRSGPGRPAGSKNRRTLRDVETLLASHLDPRAKALWIVEQHPADLAVLWSCSVFEAAQEQRLWALGVLPYVAAKITPEVIDNRQVINLTIGRLDGGDRAGFQPGVTRVLAPEEYQRVSDAEASDV